jgi:hypothetical protein
MIKPRPTTPPAEATFFKSISSANKIFVFQKGYSYGYSVYTDLSPQGFYVGLRWEVQELVELAESCDEATARARVPMLPKSIRELYR